MPTFVVQSHRGVEQLVARRAHNPEAGGSSPSPATKINGHRKSVSVFYFLYLIFKKKELSEGAIVFTIHLFII